MAWMNEEEKNETEREKENESDNWYCSFNNNYYDLIYLKCCVVFFFLKYV